MRKKHTHFNAYFRNIFLIMIMSRILGKNNIKTQPISWGKSTFYLKTNIFVAQKNPWELDQSTFYTKTNPEFFTLSMGLNRKVRIVYQLQETLADIDKELVLVSKDAERLLKLKLKSS